MNTSWQGEVQFVAYTDSSRSGPRVTFRLPDRDELQQFIGLEGRRFMLAMVEVADDETPAVPQDEPAPEPVQESATIGPLCKWVAIRCGEKSFQRWLQVSDAAEAREQVLSICGVASRKDLDTNRAAAEAFHAQIRQPYAAWLQEQAVPA